MAGEGRDGMEELIPENSTLARRIRAAASKGTLSHAAILSGSGDRMAAARYFAAALECEGEGERPCLRCRQCRKVLEDIQRFLIHRNGSTSVCGSISGLW